MSRKPHAGPLQPARIDFSDPLAPLAPEYGDVYHSRAGALPQSRHVFLGANGLPGRWAGREEFVILETGFGLGNNFLATWDAWRQDAARCQRLVFISIEKHPLQGEDLQRAHADSELPELAAALHAAWPPLTPDLHRLSFEGGRVQLLLCLGDARAWLRELVAEVDAFYLDGFNPKQNPEMWDAYLLKALGRLAAPGASAGTWSVAPQVREGLAAAGFQVERQRGFANKGGMCVARYAPRHQPQKPAGRLALAPGARRALVIGSGLAGAACAWALAQRGIHCTVIDAHAAPAQASSGNPGGLFHGTLNPDDGVHARFNRAAALETERVLREHGAALPWLQHGLLRLETRLTLAQMQAQLAGLGLPHDYVRALDTAAAVELTGLALRHPAWLYPGGGALPPPAWVAHLLAESGAQLRLGHQVAQLRQAADGGWQAWDEQKTLIGEAPLLVLAGGHRAQALLQALAPDLPLPLLQLRGQLSHVPELPAALNTRMRPRLPVAGLGYAIADTAQGLWCGATSQDGDLDPDLREADHARNLAQFSELAGLAPDDGPLQAQGGRVGWRLATADRLPLVGGLPVLGDGALPDQLRFLPRRPGLAVCMGMGSRGISWAALCAQVLAAQVTGAPLPLEASLVEAIDPARFLLRVRRQAGSAAA
ncbi:oxidoreductase [Paucibacter aquatile]|uniref:tRNA 5-methylaminomethyl-2-thiouridine biosynthesis bifunctional protein MnmC n=1 Tax=Kinneretia aquatilis TaxID=2070761 RepID=A0A2N8KUC7_9BURK|nr:FAD-dependent 5-carboxymethylaminomethyl-2-thiouridine(34) oxidoreductase MnmC [Paucibacter aquatile]PND37065.1 oxidoreductase [Paucibacter aquatile]